MSAICIIILSCKEFSEELGMFLRELHVSWGRGRHYQGQKILLNCLKGQYGPKEWKWSLLPGRGRRRGSLYGNDSGNEL